jgi:18S rRNA (adenine1779-N6/adenine1780-N6)-dimethyltransferase
LGGIFRAKSVLELIEANYKTYAALKVGGAQQKMLGAATMGKKKKTKGGARVGLGDDDEGDVAMGEAGPGAGGAKATKEGVRALVEEVLASNAFEQMRASKMSQDDFMLLLATFNEKGIHFA